MTNYIWDVTSGNFGAASSWNPNGTPTSADTTDIGTTTSLFGSGSAASLSIYNAITVTISAALTTTITNSAYIGGTSAPIVDVDAAWSDTSNITVGGNGGGSGSLYVNTGGSITATELYIGPNYNGSGASGTGMAVVQGGGKVTTNGPYYDEVGAHSGGNGSLTVTGAGSSWTSGQGLTVGDNGTGTLTVSSGATLNTPVLDVGVSYNQPTVASGSGTAIIESGGVVTTTGQYQEIGNGATGTAGDAIEGPTGAVTVTGAGSEWNAENGQIGIGDAGSKTGSLTISNDGTVVATNGFFVGDQFNGPDGSYGSLLIESGGTAATGGYNQVGTNNSGAPTSTATVTGAGSSWTVDGELAIYATGEVFATSGGSIDATSSLGLDDGCLLQVDSASSVEVGDAGGAALGYLTVDSDSNYDSNLYGDGTIEADVIDNGKVYSQQGTLLFEGPTGAADTGTISGDGNLFIGTQSTLSLSVASVASSLFVTFSGFDGTLAVESSGFAAPIHNFGASDTIDIEGLAYEGAPTGYTFTPSGSNSGGALVVTQGSSSATLDIASAQEAISGHLTLSSDGHGGTDVNFTNGASASPFNLWSTEGSFFTTLSGNVNGEDYGYSAVTDGGTPIWMETETSASGYVSGSGAPDNYSIVLATQDWLGAIQPEITIATDNNFVDPFVDDKLAAGNLGAATIFSNSSSQGQGGIVYWTASSTTGDYAVDFEPFTVSYPTSTPSSDLVTITGSPVTMISAIANPLNWTFGQDTSTSLVFAYMTQDTSTTENLYMQAFNASGAATNSAPVLIASNLADGTPYYVGYDSNTNDSSYGYGYRYLEVGSSVGTGLVGGTFNTTTGAVGAPSLYLSLPQFTAFDGVASETLADGASLRLIEGVANGQDVLEVYVNKSLTTTFDLSAADDHFAMTKVYDINTDNYDDTVVAYTDAGKVHLELLSQSGQQIGGDYVVPGISSFLHLNLMQGLAPHDSTRVELDYEVADPNGGQEVEGFIFDTDSAPYNDTLSGGSGLWDGSPFDDTFNWGAGVYTIDGGGGNDTFVATNLVVANSNLTITMDAAGEVIVNDGAGDVDTLIGFTTIDLADATVTISGNTLTLNETDGNRIVETFNIAGLPYASTQTVFIASSQSTSATLYKSDGTVYLAYGGPVSVSTYLAEKSALDALSVSTIPGLVPGGFIVGDSLANISANLSTLNGDAHVTSLEIVDTAADIAAAQTTFNSLISSGRVTLVSTSNYDLNIAAGESLTLIGGGNTANFSGAGNAIGLDGTNNAWDLVNGSNGSVDLTNAQANVVGGGDAIDILGGSGNAVSLYDTGDNWDAVYASNAVVNLTQAQTNLVGGNDAVYTDQVAGDVVSLYDTGGNWDSVYASNALVDVTQAQTNLVGGNNAVYTDNSGGDVLSLYYTGGKWDSVYASNALVDVTQAQTNLVGGNNAVYTDNSALDVLSLYYSGGKWDSVYASNALVDVTQAQTNLVGGDNTVYTDNSALDVLSLYYTGGKWDSLYASNAVVDVTQAQTNLVGGNNTVYTDNSVGDVLSLYYTGEKWDSLYASNAVVDVTLSQTNLVGGNNTVYTDNVAGDVLSLYGTGGNWDSLYASNALVDLTQSQTNLLGGGDTVYTDGSASDVVALYDTNGAADAIHGANGTINLGNAQANVFGGGETVYLGGSDTLGFQAAFGLDTINGYTSADTLVFSAADQGKLTFTQSNGNTLIELDAGDTLTLTNVQASSLGPIKYV